MGLKCHFLKNQALHPLHHSYGYNNYTNYSIKMQVLINKNFTFFTINLKNFQGCGINQKGSQAFDNFRSFINTVFNKYMDFICFFNIQLIFYQIYPEKHYMLCFVKIGYKLEFVEPLSLLRRQLPIKWGAYIRLPPGGEGVTVGDGRGD